jgi:hypothetical protein
MKQAEQDFYNWQLGLEHASGEYDANPTEQNGAELVAAAEGYLAALDALARERGAQ